MEAANGLKRDLLVSQGKASVVLPIGPEGDSDNLKKVSDEGGSGEGGYCNFSIPSSL